jgi:3-mercaptopyruvate sulfurtransferase SseA
VQPRRRGLRALDARWRYDHDPGTGMSARDACQAEHVPGAAFVDLETMRPA